VVEHPRPREQVLGDGERAVRVVREQHALGQLGRGAQVDRVGVVALRQAANPRLPSMAKRPSTPGELREAVERTVQATLGSAERQRERTQGALDDLAGTVDQLRRGAGAGLARGRRAIEGSRPATNEDVREIKAELRRIGRRLDAIEDRLPAKRSAGSSRSTRKKPKT
jgi:hypothetical protein